MLEIELKAEVKNPDVVYDFLARQGFRVQKYIVRDVYYAHPCRKFEETDEELRVRREYKGKEEKLLITYKSLVEEGDRVVREEIETIVHPEIIRIIERLGFRKALFKEKIGWYLSKDDLKITLCRVKGGIGERIVDLGYFIEVEILIDETENIEEHRRRIEEFIRQIPGVGNIDLEYYTEKIERIIRSK